MSTPATAPPAANPQPTAAEYEAELQAVIDDTRRVQDLAALLLQRLDRFSKLPVPPGVDQELLHEFGKEMHRSPFLTRAKADTARPRATPGKRPRAGWWR